MFVNDEFKVSDKLTLTLGLRFDYQSARTEREDQMLHLQPDDAEPRRGRHSGRDDLRGRRSGALGTAQVRGRPQGCLGSARWASPIESTTSRPFAAATGSTTRTSRSASSAVRRRRDSHRTPFAPNNTNGIFPGASPGRGLPAGRSPVPPFIDPTINLGGNVIAVTPDGLTLPRFQNWSVTYQRQLTDNMMLDVSYIGNRGSRLNHHWQTLGVDANMNHPDVLALGSRVLQANINSPLARAPASRSLSGIQRQRGTGAPEISAVSEHQVARQPGWRSQYHALEVVLERRFSRGLQARVGYTYSHLKNNGAETGQGR